MSYPQTANSLPLPAPTGGLNTRDPLTATPITDSPWLLNMEPESQYLRVRNGWGLHANVSAITEITRLGILNGTMYAVCRDAGTTTKIYNVTTSSPTLVHTAGALGSAAIDMAFFQTMIFTGWNASTMKYYDGGTWATWTGGSGVAITNYKGRFYTFYSTSLVYGALAAITGAGTTVDYGQFLDGGSSFRWADVLTSSKGVAAESFLAFGTDEGDALVFGGDNPGASNWGLVAKFTDLKIPFSGPDIVQSPSIAIKGDVFVVTTSGLVSLRRLLSDTSGSVNDDVLLTAKIAPYWTNLIYQGAKYAGMTYWPEKDRLYIAFNGFVDADGVYDSTSQTLLVYNFISGAWCVQKLTFTGVTSSKILVDLRYLSNALYLATGNVVMKLGSTFKDEDDSNLGNYSSYSYALHGPYTNLGNAYSNKQVQGFEPILNTDFSGANIKMRAAADFGRRVSGTTAAVIGSGYVMPFYSVGIDGSYVQYRFEGDSDTTATSGMEIYSIGMSVT